jgi:hypothetical protein
MREQFDAEDTEEPHMSMDEMTRGLDRAQAAKFFYQVCGKLSLTSIFQEGCF